MDKKEFQEAVERTGSSLMKAAKHLGIAESTVSRWDKAVPGYALWYAKARFYIPEAHLKELDELVETGRAEPAPSQRELREAYQAMVARRKTVLNNIFQDNTGRISRFADYTLGRALEEIRWMPRPKRTLG